MKPPPRPALPPTHTVSWDALALDDVDALEALVAQDKPMAAARLRLKLVDKADTLAWTPYRGTRVRGRLFKLLAHSPYVIRYVVDPFDVTIVSVRREPAPRRRRR